MFVAVQVSERRGGSVKTHVDKDTSQQAEFAMIAGMQVEGEQRGEEESGQQPGHAEGEQALWVEAGANGRSDVLVFPGSHLRVQELMAGGKARPAAIKTAVAESSGRMVAARMCVGDCVLMDADLVHGCEGGRDATRLYWRIKGDGELQGKNPKRQRE